MALHDDSFETAYGILTSGAYVAVLGCTGRSVDFVLYDVSDGRLVGSFGLGLEDRETLAADAALVGRRLVYAAGPKIYLADVGPRAQLLHDRKRWPAPSSISVARGLAWHDGNRILGLRLPDA